MPQISYTTTAIKIMPFSVSHFEVAKKLEMTSLDFHVGNLLPDINHYTHLLTKEQTHYITFEPKRVYGNTEAFYERNIKHKKLDEKSYYFALGHMVHLITDLAWGETFYIPVFSRYKDEKERTRRYFSTQWHLLNDLFARWEETPEIKEEFLHLKKYPFFPLSLSYPFQEINIKKLPDLFETLINIQFTIKHTFHFSEEELYRYEKELKRYIADDYYEQFLNMAIEKIHEELDRYKLPLII
jgi:hypothetical protein